MSFDIQAALILGLMLLVPALVVFLIVTLIRAQRGKLPRHRLPRKDSRT